MDVLLRQDFATFTKRAFRQLNPGTHCLWNWHLDLIADRLTRVARGEIRRLIINVPPRSLKSISASVAFPAWILGHQPHRRLICVSYGQELANKHARDTLSVMQSSWYDRLFSGAATPLRTAAADIQTADSGGRMATSVGGVLTGRGGDIVIIDDPTKPDEVLSEAHRAAANDWFDNTLLSRLDDKRTGAIVLIMQRQHLQDMVGHVLEKGEAWEIVCLPAIATQPECWRYTTLGGQREVVRRTGDVLHPEREPREELEKLRRDMGSYVFEAQYLQAPVPEGGGLVKRGWIHSYPDADLPLQFDEIVQSWDTASRESELSDYSVCTTWGCKDKRAYLLHVFRERLDYPALKREVVARMKLWQATTVLIEDKASGIQLIQELKHESAWSVVPVTPVGDKLMRMQSQTAAIENGFIRFPEAAPWLDAYLSELTAFPGSPYKDQVDSTSQALAWIAQRFRVPSGVAIYTAKDGRNRRVGFRDSMDEFMGLMEGEQARRRRRGF